MLLLSTLLNSQFCITKSEVTGRVPTAVLPTGSAISQSGVIPKVHPSAIFFLADRLELCDSLSIVSVVQPLICKPSALAHIVPESAKPSFLMAWTSSKVRSVNFLCATIRVAICFLTVIRFALSPQVVPLLANDSKPELPINTRSCSNCPCVTKGP
ncbi:hypothetical protein D3C73_1029560 [compost metagenome]